MSYSYKDAAADYYIDLANTDLWEPSSYPKDVLINEMMRREGEPAFYCQHPVSKGYWCLRPLYYEDNTCHVHGRNTAWRDWEEVNT